MKQKNKLKFTIIHLTLIFALLIVFLAGLLLLYFKYEHLWDTKQKLPLNKNQVYMITIKNAEVLQLGKNVPTSFYVITPIKHIDSESSLLFTRSIGTKTEFDFTPFLNQPVYVEGKFYEGIPIRIYPAVDKENPIPVLKINNLELAN